MKIKDVQLGEPFQSLFRIKDANYKDILASMKKKGYMPNEEISIWKEENILIDGYTRLKAAKELSIEEIPVKLCTFKNEEEAIEYTIQHNSNRRAVTAGDKFRLCGIVDEKGKAGKGFHGNKYTGKVESPKNLGDSKNAKHTAKLLGVSEFQVNKYRMINDYCDQDDIDAVRDDEMSIDAAWKEAKKIKEKMEAEIKAAGTFNHTNENIEWALWTWNPVTGCKHGCKYCYARDIANRFYKQGFEPTLHKSRLQAPRNNKIPKEDETGEHNVFVCSMGDLLGDWVPKEWIDKVFDAIDNAPDWWNFLLLTKNPKRYLELDLPESCWIGATATNQKQMNTAIEAFSKKEHPIKFISCEPLMEEINISNPKAIQWLIIGGRTKSTGMPAGQPEWKWVENLLLQVRQSNIPVYFKPNLTVQPKEYPEI